MPRSRNGLRPVLAVKTAVQSHPAEQRARADSAPKPRIDISRRGYPDRPIRSGNRLRPPAKLTSALARVERSRTLRTVSCANGPIRARRGWQQRAARCGACSRRTALEARGNQRTHTKHAGGHLREGRLRPEPKAVTDIAERVFCSRADPRAGATMLRDHRCAPSPLHR